MSLEAHSDAFYLNGNKTTLLSGALHYFRVLPEYWEDRLLRLKACGLNCVETYVPWNLHEEIKNEFNFEGILNIRKFLQTAHSLGLYVIFRPGPYICSEWDFGGLPSWLLHDPCMKVRSSYKPFLDAVTKFYSRLLPLVVDLQFHKGGPIIAIQIENEYGSYGDDVEYLGFLKHTLEVNGISELLFTSDNGTGIQGIQLPGVLMTANFQEKDHGFIMFEYLKNMKQPKMPLMAMEFWTGWFDHWGEKHHVVSNEQFGNVLSWILDQGASVNFYMFHGGTNFGFMAGANEELGASNDGEAAAVPYASDVTSYDYDAPVAENGDLTEKYFIIQKAIQARMPERIPSDIEVSPIVDRFAYDEVKVTRYLAFEDILNQIEAIPAQELMTMEQLFINNGGGQGYGFILYQKVIGDVKKVMLPGKVKDRAIVMLNGKELETVDSSQLDTVINLPTTEPGTNVLDILVENLGRVNYASFKSSILNEQHKGLKAVHLDGRISKDWLIYPMEMKKSFIDRLTKSDRWTGRRGVNDPSATSSPCMCEAILTISGNPKDTFLDMTGWRKGVVFVNGFNLGRYWEIGPQATLYLPAPLLKEGENQVLIFELHQCPADVLRFVAQPKLGEVMLHKTIVPAWAKSLLFVLKNSLRLGSWVWTVLRPFLK